VIVCFVDIGRIVDHHCLKQTITSHLKQMNIKKTMTFDVENSGPGLGQAQKCGGVEPVNGNSTLPLLIIVKAIQI
jgi:hypothetical protein